MNAKKEFHLLITLLAIVFVIVGFGIVFNAQTMAQSNWSGVNYIVLLAIGILYLKDGMMSFIEGIAVIIENAEKPEIDAEVKEIKK